MTWKRIPFGARQTLTAILVLLLLFAGAVFAAQSAQKDAPAKKGKAAEIPVIQKIDEVYSAKIKEYTTEKFFLTELVDHVPASDKVPTPDKVIGYVVGTPNKLTYSKDIYRYLRELEKTSPRVKTFVMGQTEEGREMLLAAISDETTIQNLARYKEITAKLADPRQLSNEDAQKLIADGKTMYWASGSIHSGETGSPEMLMELAYRVAVEETPFIQAIRKNSIILITPLVEVDGHDKQVDIYRYRKANPNKPAPSLLWWGKYVAHDNNRDGMAMSLALTRNMMKSFLEWHPTVLHDLHESVPFLYTSTGTGPYNAWLDPIVINEWQLLAYHEVTEMTKRGVPGIWTQGFYDGWAPNYMFYIANGHNSIGRFYETFGGGGGADTSVRRVGEQTQRAWYRPNPPLPRVNWSIRNNINLQQSAILLAMNQVSINRERYLENFYLKSRRSIAKATNEGPAAWIIPGDEPRPVEAAELVNLLKLQGCEVHKSDSALEVKEGKFPADSYVVRMDQPYSRMADMLLDTQYFNVNEPRPYDDTGWTLGPLKNIKTVRVMDAAILKAPMTLIAGEAKHKGQVVSAGNTVAYIINHNTDNTLMTFRFRMKDVKMQAAEDAFKIGDHGFNAGSFLIKTEGAPSDLAARLGKETADLGLTAYGVTELPKVAIHDVSAPRIALMHTWTSTQTEGWFRIALDRLQIPYAYISVHTVRDTLNLRDKYDVIIFGPVSGSAQSIVRGLPKRGEPIAWKKTDQTPNLGTEDSTDDMRGGMELAGVLNLQKFIENGGLFITVGSNSALPIDYGIVEGVSIVPSQQLQARGSIFNATFADKKSPIAYGYGDKLAVYFSQAPLLEVQTGLGGFGGRGGGGGGGGAPFGGRGGEAGRPSGRGTLTDADVPQGRPLTMGQPPAEQPTPPGEEGIPEEFREQARAFLPPVEMRPRVVLRFAPEKELLVSGMLAGGQELAGKAAVVDLPVGKGHVVMFANNPMWRQETNGSFFLLFNAALHYDNLGAGRSAQPARSAPPDDYDN